MSMQYKVILLKKYIYLFILKYFYIPFCKNNKFIKGSDLVIAIVSIAICCNNSNILNPKVNHKY
jgi:hypothetical protein